MISVIILAIIQGIAEFLPISSSAHLIIFRDLFGIGSNEITNNIDIIFDIALHFGTLLAILIYFHKDLFKIFKDGLTKGTKTKKGNLFWLIVIATIPAAIMGTLFEDVIEEKIRDNYILIGICLIIMGILLYFIDKKSKMNKNIDKMNIKDALLIGFSQIFALIPGFSRSGTTITMSRYLNYDRKTSATFSFYLSIPIIMGATFLSIIKENNINLISENINYFLIGIGVSFIVGLLTISFFLKYINKNNYKIFMDYRILIGLIVIIYSIIK